VTEPIKLVQAEALADLFDFFAIAIDGAARTTAIMFIFGGLYRLR
jgi:hypothetical protein